MLKYNSANLGCRRSTHVCYLVKHEEPGGLGRSKKLEVDKELELSWQFVIEECPFLFKKMLYDADNVAHQITSNIYEWPIVRKDIQLLEDALRLLGAFNHPSMPAEPIQEHRHHTLLEKVSLSLQYLPIYSYLQAGLGLNFCDHSLSQYLEENCNIVIIRAMEPDDKNRLISVLDAVCLENLPNCQAIACRVAGLMLDSFIRQSSLTTQQVANLADAVTLVDHGKLLTEIGFNFQGDYMEDDDKKRLAAYLNGRKMVSTYRYFAIRGSRLYDGRCYVRQTGNGLEFTSEKKQIGGDEFKCEDGFHLRLGDNIPRHLCITRCQAKYEWIIVGRANYRIEQLDVELFRADGSFLDSLPPFHGWRSASHVTSGFTVRVLRYGHGFIQHSNDTKTRTNVGESRNSNEIWLGEIHTAHCVAPPNLSEEAID